MGSNREKWASGFLFHLLLYFKYEHSIALLIAEQSPLAQDAVIDLLHVSGKAASEDRHCRERRYFWRVPPQRQKLSFSF